MRAQEEWSSPLSGGTESGLQALRAHKLLDRSCRYVIQFLYFASGTLSFCPCRAHLRGYAEPICSRRSLDSMMCLCSNTPMPTVPPNPHLAIRAVPPQFKNLLGLLGLEDMTAKLRMDQQLAQALPPGGPSWITASLAAQAPKLALPAVLPPGGGVAMMAMLRLSASAKTFPLTNPKALLAQLTLAIRSLQQFAMPRLQAVAHIPTPALQRMALAARMTLDMRQQGVCPMIIANVDMRAGLTNSVGRAQASVNFAAKMPTMRIPPFALPGPQLKLAQSLAGLASLGGAAQSMGMPPMSDPNFMGAFRSQMQMLAKMPMPPKISLLALQELTGKIADIDVIEEAFGPGAMTPGGISRVNAMLKYFTKLQLPMPPVALELKEQLDMTPDIADVLKGMETVKSSGAALAMSASASASVSAAIPPIIPVMEALSSFGTMLGKHTGKSPFGSCITCSASLKDITKGLDGVSLPKAPSLASLL